MENDKGHEELIRDIEYLLDEAKAFTFHDFKNEVYAFPKKTLVERLEMIKENVISGKYDN